MSQLPLDASHCQALLEGLPVGIAISNAGEQVTWVNAAFCELLATEPESVLGASVAAVLGSRAEPVRANVRRYVVVDDEGRARWLECAAASVVGDDGLEATLRLFTDITAFEIREKGRAATAAGLEADRIDPDTGLLNRQAIVQELNSQISRSRRYASTLSLIQILLGDEESSDDDGRSAARGRITECLKGVLRWADFVGSLSSDELLVILPETRVEPAREVIKKIQGALADAADEQSQGSLDARFATTGWDQGDTMQSMFERLRQELQNENDGDR